MSLSLVRFAVALAAGLLLAPPARADVPPALTELMRALAGQKTSKARFVERRFMAMLSEPLRSDGTLAYTAPDKLEKRTLAPRLQTLSVDGDRLVVDPGPDGGPRTLSLAAQPEIAAMVEAIRGTLAGDLAGLERYYRVTLEGGPPAWTLELEPRGETVRKLVTAIRLIGKATAIETVEIRETDGDRTEMLIFEEPR